MPKKGIKFTQEHKDKISESNKVSLLGNINHLGFKHSEETKNIIKNKLKGVKREYMFREKTENHKESLKLAWIKRKEKGFKYPMLGKKHTEETKAKMSKSRVGFIPWNKGKKIPERSGSNCHLWKGGISFEPYTLEFNEDLKEVIRNRDRRKCQICEKTELENKKKLDVHHIDYDKKNSNPNNLISLCNRCHMKTNQNREYWENLFKKYKQFK